MLPKRLREARTEKGYTQEDVADFLGFTRPTYTSYESGRRRPDQDTLVKIAQFLNVSTDYLLGLTDEPKKQSPEKIIADALASDPELAEFWKELTKRDDLQIMFKQVKDMPEETIKRIIRYIKMVEDEEAQE